MNFPIIDLHCDLLAYLVGDRRRTPFNASARCSLPQLKAGNVKLQTLAVFTETKPDSVKKGLCQVQIFAQLLKLHAEDLLHYQFDGQMPPAHVATLLAIENASGFCSENESLQDGMKRLHGIVEQIAKPLYISLTWNSENRFGGGAQSKVGLKDDGRRLLDEMHVQKIAIDLSHTSDALAHDIIDYIDRQKLIIPIMASHSNARAVTSAARNLPDELAKEIFRRKGIVGLNLYRPFLGEKEEDLPKHLAHWLDLGGKDSMAFGADFFYELNWPSTTMGSASYFENYHNASCYGRLLSFLQSELNLDRNQMEKLAYGNALKFLDAR
jgi:membrane dipeptidase